MLRFLLMAMLLRRLRRDHPELFDGEAALRSVTEALAEGALEMEAQHELPRTA